MPFSAVTSGFKRSGRTKKLEPEHRPAPCLMLRERRCGVHRNAEMGYYASCEKE